MPRHPGGPYRVDLQNPVADHPLNHRGLASWWLPLPHLSGGRRLWDLCNRNHGTLTNHPTDGTAWSGGPGGFGSITFDGTNDTVEVGVATSTQITGDLSVFAVAKTTSSSTYKELFQAANSVSPYLGYGFGIGGTVGRIGLWQDGFGDWKSSSGTWNDGQWHHIGLTINAVAGSLTFYIDGKDSGTGTAGTRGISGQAKSIGGASNIPRYLACSLAELRIYSGLLSPVEVRALYDQSLRGHPDTLRRYPERSWFVLRESAADVFDSSTFPWPQTYAPRNPTVEVIPY